MTVRLTVFVFALSAGKSDLHPTVARGAPLAPASAAADLAADANASDAGREPEHGTVAAPGAASAV